MSIQEIRVPDIGSDEADVIEVLVKPGDSVAAESSLIVLESAKATMEVPCPAPGTVQQLSVKVGDKVKEGDLILLLQGGAGAESPVQEITQALEVVSTTLAPEPVAVAAPSVAATESIVLKAPDIGSDSADVIEVLVKPGDEIAVDQPVLVLESAKATMEVPAAQAGRVEAVLVKVGDKVSEGVALLQVLVAGAAPAPVAAPAKAPAPAVAPAPQQAVAAPAPVAAPTVAAQVQTSNAGVHAGPAVRRLARELGVDLGKVTATGPKSRILKDDVHAFVKKVMTESAQGKPVASGTGLPALPEIDFSKWGEVELKPLTKIQKLSAQNLHRAWVTIPHVTQFDEADITELEAFRSAQKDALKAQGVNLTPLAFMVKACAHVLKQFPKFNSSLAVDGENLVWKKYIHIGVAVDTPNGLVVPVIRNADSKSVSDIARELGEISVKARDKKLSPADMAGATFSISSLGGIGGTAFTPIVNWPEVAILGVSRSAMKPVWNGKDFSPRLMLPLSLSYDHRVIDGADAARFTTALGKVLGDIRQMLL